MFDRTEYNKKYYEINKERLIKRQIEWNKKNRDIYRSNNNNHYMKKKIKTKVVIKTDKESKIYEDMDRVKYLFDTERALDIADVLDITGWDLKYVTKICTKMHIKHSKWYYQRLRKEA
jgi:hypothetical protein